MKKVIKTRCGYQGPCGNSRWRRPNKVIIYLMQIGESSIYKIGYTSKTPEERIRGIRFYFPEIKLVDHVMCDFVIEKKLHDLFKGKKVDNGYKEFFELSTDDVLYVLNLFKTLKNGETEKERS